MPWQTPEGMHTRVDKWASVRGDCEQASEQTDEYSNNKQGTSRWTMAGQETSSAVFVTFVHG